MTRNSPVQFGGGPIEKEHPVTSLSAYPTKIAILGNAAAIILLHNHPSGDPTPSNDDLQITTRLCQIGEVLGIRVLDHVVIGDGRYVSFVDDGYFPRSA
jgi:DNA repair protein RadC